eukprot:6173643-Pleurochrysis_carterae.AAC.3
MLATTIYAAAAAAFYGPTTLHTSPRSSYVAAQPRQAVVMSEGPSRREFLGFTLAVLPVSAAFADAKSVDTVRPLSDHLCLHDLPIFSTRLPIVAKEVQPLKSHRRFVSCLLLQMEAARAIYGSAIFKLQGKSTADIANAKDTFKRPLVSWLVTVARDLAC